jgi:hypothetical protein
MIVRAMVREIPVTIPNRASRRELRFDVIKLSCCLKEVTGRAIPFKVLSDVQQST